MDALMVILRILHIVFGVFWVGTLIFMVILLEPKLRSLGANIQGPVMGALVPAMTLYMVVSALVTAGSGIALTLIVRWGNLGAIIASGWGWAILLGFVTTLAAIIIGFGVIVPTGRRQGALAASIQGRPPKPEEAQQLAQLSARIGTLSITNFVLLLIAVVTMAIARYI